MSDKTKELLKFALEQKPNAFKEKFDEILLGLVVQKTDEIKSDMTASAFEESADPEEDDFDIEDEDLEDFDLDDEDLDDLDIDDLDFEDEEDKDGEVSESYETVETNRLESGRLRNLAAKRARDARDLKDDHRFSRKSMGHELQAQADETQQQARVLDVKTKKMLRALGK